MQLATSFFVALHPHNDKRVLSSAVCIVNFGLVTSVWVQSTISCIHNVDSSLVIFTTYGPFFSLANDNRPYFLWIKEENKKQTALSMRKKFWNDVHFAEHPAMLRKMFFVLSRAWDKEKILSPHEESNLRPSDLRSDALPLSHKDSMMSENYYEVHMTRVFHTTGISNVDSVMFCW